MASKTLLLLFGIFLLLLAIHELQVDALRILPQQQIQEAEEGDAGAMKESFVQQIQSQNLPVGKALMYSKPNMIMPEAGVVEALDANKKADLACGEKKKEKEKKKKKCEEKKKKKPPCSGEKGEEAITD